MQPSGYPVAKRKPLVARKTIEYRHLPPDEVVRLLDYRKLVQPRSPLFLSHPLAIKIVRASKVQRLRPPNDHNAKSEVVVAVARLEPAAISGATAVREAAPRTATDHPDS
jgi:hypothetical protein